jgi:hypothetical protein
MFLRYFTYIVLILSIEYQDENIKAQEFYQSHRKDIPV